MGKIVFVGVGGIGVSSLARLFLELGYENLLGLEKNPAQAALNLQRDGLEVIFSFGSYEVQPDDLVIYSAAREHVPEVQQAKQLVGSNHKRVSPPMLYFQFVGELSKYLKTIAVSGTHGKSTTTGMVATTLAQHHPDFGLCLLGTGVNARDGSNMHFAPQHQDALKQIVDHIISPKGPAVGDIMKELLFVIEADEFNKHFLYLDPDYSIITNLELDHSDIYPTEDNYVETYLEFASNTRYKVFMLKDARFLQEFRQVGSLQAVPKQQFDFSTLIGGHNHLNASLAHAVCIELGVEKETATQALEDFQGLWRRAEIIGKTDAGATIISDYAHHPTEIKSTYEALQTKYPDKELLCVFQPHQVRRVLEFRDEFIDTLNEIDHCMLYAIYAAREDLDNLKTQFSNEATRHVHSVKELGELLATTTKTTYATEFEQVEEVISKANANQLVVLFSAAGSDKGIDYEVRERLGSR